MVAVEYLSVRHAEYHREGNDGGARRGGEGDQDGTRPREVAWAAAAEGRDGKDGLNGRRDGVEVGGELGGGGVGDAGGPVLDVDGAGRLELHREPHTLVVGRCEPVHDEGQELGLVPGEANLDAQVPMVGGVVRLALEDGDVR